MSNPISRRKLLANAAALGVLAPFLSFTGGRRAHAQAAGNKCKALFVYVPDGCIPDRWHPTGSERSFTLPAMTAPLAAVQQHITFLKGLDMYAGGATHEGGIRKVLTGAGPISLDVFLGQTLNGTDPLPHSSLQLGVAVNFENGSGGMSFIGENREVKPDDDPLNAFSRVFGGIDGGGGGGGTPDPAIARRRSILDLSLGDIRRVRDRLGTLERDKLDTHLESFREVERRVNPTQPPAAACNVAGYDRRNFQINPNDFYPKTFHKEQNFQTVGELHMDIAALAFSCRMTRVASLMWSHPVSPTHVPASGTTLGNHDASHYGNADSPTAAAFIQLKRWFNDRFVYLINKLKNTPDPDGGSVLDNTVVFLCSELGDSNNHDHRNMPFLVAGGAAGKLQGGRFLDFSRSQNGENQPHTKLLVSIARAMGVSVDSFGYTGHGTGPLPGLMTGI
jgi:hypothetical protein